MQEGISHIKGAIYFHFELRYINPFQMLEI